MKPSPQLPDGAPFANPADAFLRKRFSREIELWAAGKTMKEIGEATDRRVREVSGIMSKHRSLFPYKRVVRRELAEIGEKFSREIALWKEGKNVPEIAAITKAPEADIRYATRMYRELFPKRWTSKGPPETRYADLIQMWNEGKTVSEMASLTGRPFGTVGAIVNQNRHLFQRRRLQRSSPSEVTLDNIRHGKTVDEEFNWLVALCSPKMEGWRRRAAMYRAHCHAAGVRSFTGRMGALNTALEKHIAHNGLYDVKAFFLRDSRPPPLPTGSDERQVKLNINFFVDFLDWILVNDDEFTEENEEGLRETLRTFRNPYAKTNLGKVPLTETVRTPLPFIWVVKLRKMLAEGLHFRDWRWAAELDRDAKRAGTWFEVNKAVVEKGRADPDFVWEERTVPVYDNSGYYTGGSRKALYVCSPVQFVALLLKLLLPLRLIQIRLLDDGTTDIERCDLLDSPSAPDDITFNWTRNQNRDGFLARMLENDRVKLGGHQGVFIKLSSALEPSHSTGFFINTNKTADIDKPWGKRGYVIQWENREALRWLLKLRNWQERYNPCLHAARWTDLQPRHLASRAEQQLTGAPPTFFLFRDPTSIGMRNLLGADERHLPITGPSVDRIWAMLLLRLEEELWTEGLRTKAGERVKFIKQLRRKAETKLGQNTTFFPLHSLRVSLLTALAMDGGVSIRTLMKLAGHSRILMAIYYQKLGSVAIGVELEEGCKRALELGEKRIETYLSQESLDRIASLTIGSDDSVLSMSIAADPANRSSVGHMRVLGGYCLVGCNRILNPEDPKLGGCYNGGVQTSLREGQPIFESVKPLNCIAGGCRFFRTRPEFIPEIVPRIRNLVYHLSAHEDRINKLATESEALEKEEYDLRKSRTPGAVVAPGHELDRVRRDLLRLTAVSEKEHADYDEVLHNLRNSLWLLGQCRDKLLASKDTEQELGFDDVTLSFVPSSTELQAHAQVCSDAVKFRSLRSELGVAIERRSQLIDNYIIVKNLNKLPLLSPLSQDQQLRLGSVIMEQIAQAAEETAPGRGLEIACEAIELKRETDPLIADALKRLLSIEGICVNALQSPKVKLQLGDSK